MLAKQVNVPELPRCALGLDDSDQCALLPRPPPAQVRDQREDGGHSLGKRIGTWKAPGGGPARSRPVKGGGSPRQEHSARALLQILSGQSGRQIHRRCGKGRRSAECRAESIPDEEHSDGGSTMTTLQYYFDKEIDVLKRAEPELPAVILPFRAELTVVR